MKETPYQNIGTFLKASQNISDNTLIKVVGIPYDGSTSYRTGTRLGPHSIREVSSMLTDGEHPEFETNPTKFLVDCGDIIVGNSFHRSMASISKWYTENSTCPTFALGGDHSITEAILKGFCDRNSGLIQNINLIIFDSHCDSWSDDFGLNNQGHGCFVKSIVENGIIDPKDIIQIGIRSPVDKKTRDWLPSRGAKVFSARYAERNTDDLIEILKNLPNKPTYISVDIDALDPAYACGTGTPEIGGLSTMTLLTLLESIDMSKLIGGDIVEVNPAYDNNGKITALAGATIIWTMMSKYLYQQKAVFRCNYGKEMKLGFMKKMIGFTKEKFNI